MNLAIRGLPWSGMSTDPLCAPRPAAYIMWIDAIARG